MTGKWTNRVKRDRDIELLDAVYTVDVYGLGEWEWESPSIFS